MLQPQPETIAGARASWSWANLLDDVRAHLRESLGVQSYFAAGLALQKGLPYLLIPLLIRLYGDHTYASYVLFYASTLMFANLLAMAVPNSIITFWYAEKDKASLSWTYIFLLLTAQAALALVLSVGVFYVYGRSFGRPQAAALALVGLVFAFLYNFNTFLTGVCRARDYSKSYFRGQVIAGITLVAGVVLLRHWPRLEVLISMFMLSLLCQNLYLLDSLREYLQHSAPCFDVRLAKRVLAYSLPLIPHLEATVFYYWVDKFLVRQYFSDVQFSQFTISFQYAFAQSFFAQVFAMHTFPLICRLVAQRDESRLRFVIRSYNLLLAALGALWIAGILLLQWFGLRLRISPIGFLVLGCSFLIWNIAGNYINVLWARFRTPSVTAVMIGAGTVLLGTFLGGCWLRSLLLCYVSHLTCATAALAGFLLLERTYRNTPAPTARLGKAAGQQWTLPHGS